MELHEGKWVKKSNKKVIDIKQMSDKHIDNTIDLIKKGIKEYEWLCWCNKYGGLKIKEFEEEMKRRKDLNIRIIIERIDD